MVNFAPFYHKTGIMTKLFRSITEKPKNDILSGLTVALALVPEAVAFAFVAGIDPLVGLYGAFMMGIVTSIFGGRPGMISGATGAMAVVMVHMIQKGNEVGEGMAAPIDNLGLQWLFITLLMVGAIQILAGVFKLGKFVRLIPHPVMMGFVNGLAIVIFLSQLGMFTETEKNPYGKPLRVGESDELAYHMDNNMIYPAGSLTATMEIKGDEIYKTNSNDVLYEIHGEQIYNAKSQNLSYNLEGNNFYTLKETTVQKKFLSGKEFWLMLALVILTMAIMFGLPKLTKKLPAALIAIIVVASITIFGNLEVGTVGSFIRDGGGTGLEGSLPSFQTQIFGLFDTMSGHWGMIISTAFLLAAVGLIESLMTLNLVDELTETRGSGNRECMAQGGANILNGLFGGMGGCAMIGQSIINVNSGGRGRLSGIVAAIALLSFILFGAALIEQIPIAALVGVMFMVVIGTFAWSSFRILHKIPLADAIVLIAVSAITVWQDLAIAVIAGVIMSALVFAWKNATMIRARKRMKDDGTKVYEIWGPLFFGSVQAFNSKFDVNNDPKMVELDFIESKVSDHSGIEAVRNIANKYLDSGRSVKLTHLSPECKEILLKANPKFAEVIETSIDDPRYYVVTDLVDEEV